MQTSTNNKAYILLFSIITIILFNYICNAHFYHTPRVLYSDELESYYLMINPHLSFWQKIFGTEVIRPIPRLIYFIIFNLCKNDFTVLNHILLWGNCLIGIIIFFISYYIQADTIKEPKTIYSLLASILYIVSRFMQCQIFSILGIMEGICHMFTLFLFFILFNMLKSQSNTNKYFWCSYIIWGVATLCHERYIILLLPISIVILFMLRKKGILKLIFLISNFFLYVFFRVLILGNNTLRGTAYTNITDTFSLSGYIKLCIKQIAYIAGINAGPQERNGISYHDVPPYIYSFIIINIILGIVICLLFIFNARKQSKEKLMAILKPICLGIIMILSCIASSSITNEIALRFVYVSYSLYLIIISYICSYITSLNKYKYFTYIFTFIFTFNTLCYDFYYRSNINNVLFWNEKTRTETFYDATVGIYHENIINKKIIVCQKTGYITPNKANKILQPYLDDKVMLDVVCISNFNELQDYLPENNNIIIIEEKYEYFNVTSTLK